MRSRSGTVPLALLAATALLSCTSSGDVRDDGGSGPPPQLSPAPEPSAEPPRIPSAPGLPGQAHELAVLDEHSAFALLESCTGTVTEPDCGTRLAVLEEGSWSMRDIPAPQLSLTALAPDRALLLPWDAERPDGESGTAWYTADAGRTWQEVGTEANGTVRGIPAGGMLVAGTEGLEVLLPGSGERRLLAGAPALAGAAPVPYPLADGSHAAMGVDPGTGKLAVAVSGDRGRTWRLGTLPGTKEDRRWWQPAGTPQIAAAPGELYAAVTGDRDTGIDHMNYNALLSLHRSTDGGHSWERVRSLRPQERPVTLLGTPIAGADGGLTVYGMTGVFHSEDGGRTFSVQRPGAPPEWPDWTRAGYLLRDIDYPGHYRVSADGFTWHTIVLGDGSRPAAPALPSR